MRMVKPGKSGCEMLKLSDLVVRMAKFSKSGCDDGKV